MKAYQKRDFPVAVSPRYPTTIHYRGDGVFMVSGRNVNRLRRFKKENL